MPGQRMASTEELGGVPEGEDGITEQEQESDRCVQFFPDQKVLGNSSQKGSPQF